MNKSSRSFQIKKINPALHFLSKKRLTRREFTANSRAAFVSEGPLCIRKKELEEASTASEMNIYDKGFSETYKSLNISHPSSATAKVSSLLLLSFSVNPGGPIEAFKVKP
ncbi:hypothetical protein CR513_31065, partial [Mucuna pruriens]